MKTAEIRSAFLKFFTNHNHELVSSSSLVPANDPTLLFTNAGMVQFKDLFLGKEKRSYTKATTVQKCVRAGGKHNDLENVGFTARHHTFFEMLGNFSFGDYFKEQAIEYAWVFSRDVLKLPLDKVYVTIYKDDDEAFQIWSKYIDTKRITRLGEKDNFWQMGDTGPCGPCSELFFDRGEKSCNKDHECGVDSDCDRFLEYWNLVFMQFNRDKDGTLTELPKPSVDTGAGLERLASILQGTKTNYEIDLFEGIISQIKAKAKNKKDMTALRVIADHSRSTSFLIADGVMPSNEGRGYVLRRIIRRAVRYGRNIGFDKPFLFDVCEWVVAAMGDQYPELKKQKSLILKCVKAEEEQFFKTLENGLSLLENEKKISKNKTINGETAFKLYDTFGFPLDLTRMICSEDGYQVDEQGFHAHMKQQKDRSRKNWSGSGERAVGEGYHEIYDDLKNEGLKFLGYEKLQHTSNCLYVSTPDKKGIFEAVFKETPFYGESGGQAGDKGTICSEDGKTLAQVLDTQKPLGNDLIVLTLKGDGVAVGRLYNQIVHKENRMLTARNHTATHMLQWALRKVLGDHVKQAGSLVNADQLRFDFSHFSPITQSEISHIENLINEKIFFREPVGSIEMDKEDAEKKGAISMFGEKYGKRVRVVSVGEDSVEFCGGTHIDNTSEINLFKIVSETGIAAGVRRIVGYTSKRAFEFLSHRYDESEKLREEFKAISTEDLLGKVAKLREREKELKKELDSYSARAQADTAKNLLRSAEIIGGVSLVTSHLQGKGMKDLRQLGTMLTNENPNLVAVLCGDEKGKAFIVTAAGKKTEHKADKLLSELAPMIGAKGGGKKDLAQAGGDKPSAITGLLDKVKELI